MVGGDDAAFAQVRPLLETMGKTITHTGPSGTGQLTKLVNQILVSLTNLAVCEALTFATAAGLDGPKTLAAVGGGAASSWQLTHLGPRMLAGDFAPGFMIKLQQKDLRLVLEAAKDSASTSAPSISSTACSIRRWPSRGEQGTQALFAVVEEGSRK